MEERMATYFIGNVWGITELKIYEGIMREHCGFRRPCGTTGSEERRRGRFGSCLVGNSDVVMFSASKKLLKRASGAEIGGGYAHAMTLFWFLGRDRVPYKVKVGRIEAVYVAWRLPSGIHNLEDSGQQF